ncbi:MAG: TIGR02265 family protein [Myxococcaceae bacterium]
MDSSDLLRLRSSQVKEKDEASGMAFEGISKVIERELGMEGLDKLRAQPKHPKRVVSVFKYPMDAFMELALYATQELAAKKKHSFDKVMTAIGSAAVEIFFDNAIGKTMLSLNGNNAQRLLTAAQFAYKTIYTFGERTYEKRGEREGVFRYRGDLAGPALQTGVLTRGLQITTNTDPKCEMKDGSADLSRFALHLKW